MTDSNYTIEVKGAGGASQSAKIDTSDIQKSLNQVSADLKKLDTSNFQKSLTELAKGIQKSATSANRFVENMAKIEAKLSASLKAGLSPGNTNSTNQEKISPKEISKKADSDSRKTERLVKTMGSLSEAIDKLTSGIKENFKPKEKPEEKPEEKKQDLVNDTKKLLAAVGIGAVVKQLAENEIVNPARAMGMLINSNVVSNPVQAGAGLLGAYQDRVASNTGSILGLVGGIAGGALGSIIPGLGTYWGAGIGYGAGKLGGDILGQTHKALELPTLQRALTTDYYSSLSKQIPGYRQFAQSQYGSAGFGSAEASQDPYFESRAEFGKGFSRFAGGSIDSDTTLGIIKSLSAQGASSPQEVNITGNLLGQIAKYTGKSSVDIEKVYKSVEKSGMSPNEGLQKALTLLQSGQSVTETTGILRNDSHRSEGYMAGQQSYLSGTPYQQFTAQLVGNVTGINEEKFFHGTPAEKEHEMAKARKRFQGADAARRKGILNYDSHMVEMMELHQNIWPWMVDNGRKVAQGKAGDGFINQSEGQDATVKATQIALDKGAAGRSPQQIINEALSEIGKSTNTFSALGKSAENLAASFETAIKSFVDPLMMRNRDPNSPLVWKSDKKILSKTKDGR